MVNFEQNDGVILYLGSFDMYMVLMFCVIDVVFYDVFNVGYFVCIKGEGKVKIVGQLYEGQQYGIVLKDGSEWVDEVNVVLVFMKEDGIYKIIYEKWFGLMLEGM